MADHEPHHAAPAHGKGSGLKKKVGPLPIWAWVLGGTAAIGAYYYLHNSSSTAATTAATTPTATTVTDPGVTDPGSGGGGSGSASPIDTSGLATGTVTTDQLDADIQAIQAQLASQSNGVVDNAPSFGQEIADVTGGITALRSAGLLSSPSTKGSSATAKGKSVAGLTIRAQLTDLKDNLVTRNQLGPNARKALTASGGNVNKAIASRNKPKPKPKPPTRRLANRPR